MLNINEIFTSIDGEVNPWSQGALTTFIRLQGCNLSCSYCDTLQAQDKDKQMYSLFHHEICKIIEGSEKVTITGGEPLLQPGITPLIRRLLYKGVKVSVETNGSQEIPIVFENEKKLSWIIDYKLDAKEQMLDANFQNARKQDWIKFVIRDEKDLSEAIEIIEKLDLKIPRIAFSPAMDKDSVRQAEWLASEMIKRKLWNVVFNLQIHKLIWADKSEGVKIL